MTASPPATVACESRASQSALMWTTVLTIIEITIPALYCLARGIIDLRARRYGWGLIGVFSAILLFLIPIPTNVIKVDLPVAGQ